MNDPATTTVNELALRISQILDNAKELTNINMGSNAGRQIIAVTLARALVINEGKENA